MLARVVIVGAVGKVDRLTYAVPPQMTGRLSPGHRVLVAVRSRRLTAIVTEIGDNLDCGGADPKAILELLEPRPLFDAAHLQLIEFLASYYMAPIGEAFRTVIPTLARVESRRMLRLVAAPDPLARAALTALEQAIVDALAKHPMTLRQLERLGDRGQVEAALSHLRAERWINLHDATRGRHRQRIAPIVRLAAGVETDKLRGRKQRAIVERLASNGIDGIRLDDLEAQIHGARTALRAMHASGVVELMMPGETANPNGNIGRTADESTPALAHIGTSSSRASGRQDLAGAPALSGQGDPLGSDPYRALPIVPGSELTPEQQAAFEAVRPAVRERRFETFLLWGVTASGKSEIYLRLAAETLASGRQVLVLVPEIALADQLVGSFRERFGVQVAIAHSAQNVAERWASWTAALSGDARIVIGPRSAIFAPINDLGLVVVDEEHDGAYKQEEGIRYNARDLAVVLGRLGNCPVVLGSATPSAESYANARQGRYRMLRLTRRVQARALATVEIVDLRQHPPVSDHDGGAQAGANQDGDTVAGSGAAEGDRHQSAPINPLSPPLIEALRDNLAGAGQSLVFLNRRGYHNFLQCHLCGNVIACANCSVSMTFHLRGRTLRCHYCGASEPAPEKCFECGGYGLEGQGFGTERLVQTLARMFPSARIERMDSDTSGRRGARSAILDGLRRGEIDILVGTQMITKGFDFPGVTLVIVVAADLALNMPDFRSAERTFQSLTQVAGRAGRGARPGRVLIQTYAPHHYSIRAARDQDYARFIRRELELRRELMYPPFARMAMVRIEGEDALLVSNAASQIAAMLARAAKPDTMRVLGPAPAPIERIRRRYRWQVMLKAQARDQLRTALAVMRAELSRHAFDRVHIVIDIDPVNMV